MKPSSRSTQRERRGFTLPEVLVAFLILFVGMTAAGLFLSQTLRGTALTSRLTVGLGLAEQKLESLLTQRQSELASGTDTPSGYAREWTVTHDGTVHVARVWVRWQDIDGGTHEVTLHEMRAH